MAVNFKQHLGALLFTGIVAFSAPAMADYDRGMAALQSGNYRVAIMEFTDAAQTGHAASQQKLGDIYRLGQGTTPDLVQAIKWLTLAYLNGMRETLPALEMLRDSVSESELVEGEQLALQWLEDANRVMFADDDTSSLYEQN
ncbi:sel1 repeat family protein [Gammaproteobacteria bacterium LSUCC0112]|nr:sel1 repeat family protein [Gammaproteobacteria bacterium LSUCC0112]